MKSDKDKIKNIFASKLNGFEPELPPSVWEKIDADLSAQQRTVSSPPKRNTIYQYLGWTASAAAIIAAAILLYPKVSDNDNTTAMHETEAKPTVTSSPIEQKTDEGIALADSRDEKEEPGVKEAATPVAVSSTKTQMASSQPIQTAIDKEVTDKANRAIDKIESAPKTFAQKTTQETELMQETAPAIQIMQEKEKTTELFTEKTKDETPVNITNTEQSEDPMALDIEGAMRSKKVVILADNMTPPDYKMGKASSKSSKTSGHGSKGFDLGVSGSSNFTKSSDVQNQLRHSTLFEYADKNNSPIVAANQSQKMKLKHNQPINVGVAVSKKISDRVSIESGVIYTYLSSKTRSVGSSDLKAKDSQYFHYLGIPLSVNYKLAEWQKLQVYLSAGGVAQKDFYGRMSTYQSIQDLANTEEIIHKTISQDHLQFSLTGGLGLSYPIYNKLSVYTQFGGAYYFDAKNEYETIYSDKKWMFNLNIGLKIGF